MANDRSLKLRRGWKKVSPLCIRYRVAVDYRPPPYPADIVVSHCSSVRSIVLDGRQEIFETDRKQKERRAISGEPQE